VIVRGRGARTVLAAALVLLASGCSVGSLRYVGMGIGDYTTTWTVGSCHRLDQPEEVDPVFPSDTSPAVPCDTPHESETYAVVPLTGAVAKQAHRPSPLWLERALTGACSWNAMTGYLGAKPLDALQDVGILQILPSEPEWERGVRQIRCDVLLGPRTSASVASASVPLHEILAGPAGDRFRVCRTGYQQVGCDQPHEAELINAWIKFTTAQLAKQTAKQQTHRIAAFCAPYFARYLGAPADRASHVVLAVTGKQVGQCWLTDAKGRAWSGSLRSGVKELP
jgi:hypothetical protein